MARTLRDARIETREARGRLEPRGRPYWRLIESGLHLGYRRLKGRSGTWWSRHYVGNQAYNVESLGAADDNSDADGVAVLSFTQAQNKARENMVNRAHKEAGKSGPLTVADVCEDYLNFLATHRKSSKDARYRYEAFIKPSLGSSEVNALTSKQLRDWLNALTKEAPRARTAKGEAQQYRELGKDDEAMRRRKVSANRTFAILKAALNMAWQEKRKLIPSDDEWRAVKPFKDVNAARTRYLKIGEAKRLINACDPAFRSLVNAALETGCRYQELARLKVHDFDEDNGTLAVRVTKTGKPRHVVLTDDGAALFYQLCAGRSGDDLILTKADGEPWGTGHQARPIAEACKRAKIKPAINFHGLRHTWASLAVMNGIPLLVVAKNLGHADTRMTEAHYGHLAPSYVADAIRAGAPQFGFKPDRNLATLAGRGRA